MATIREDHTTHGRDRVLNGRLRPRDGWSVGAQGPNVESHAALPALTHSDCRAGKGIVDGCIPPEAPDGPSENDFLIVTRKQLLQVTPPNGEQVIASVPQVVGVAYERLHIHRLADKL